MNRRHLGWVTATLVGCALIGLVASAQDKAAPKGKPEYIGAKKCIVCHKKDGTGPSWETGVHAKAWDILSPEQQKDASCATCHATGKLPTGELLTGVQCESCHGPGSLYKSKTVMESREESIKNGLIVPDEKLCRTCHSGKEPAVCKAKPFDYKERLKKGVHDMPPDSAKAAPAGATSGK